jgi:hypothetical protein
MHKVKSLPVSVDLHLKLIRVLHLKLTRLI